MPGGYIYILGSRTGTLYQRPHQQPVFARHPATIKCVPQQILFSGFGG
jgi:hypothetical protein